MGWPRRSCQDAAFISVRCELCHEVVGVGAWAALVDLGVCDARAEVDAKAMDNATPLVFAVQKVWAGSRHIVACDSDSPLV